MNVLNEYSFIALRKVLRDFFVIFVPSCLPTEASAQVG